MTVAERGSMLDSWTSPILPCMSGTVCRGDFLYPGMINTSLGAVFSIPVVCQVCQGRSVASDNNCITCSSMVTMVYPCSMSVCREHSVAGDGNYITRNSMFYPSTVCYVCRGHSVASDDNYIIILYLSSEDDNSMLNL